MKANFQISLKKLKYHLLLIKDYRGYKESDNPMSILSVIAEIFAKLLRKQGTVFMDQFLSKYQCDFQYDFHIVNNMRNKESS